MSKGGSKEDLTRQLGLTARYLTEGVSSIPLAVGDAANQIVNDMSQGIAQKTGTQPVHLDSTTSALQSMLSGLPKPQTPLEKIVGQISQSYAGAPRGSGPAFLERLASIGR